MVDPSVVVANFLIPPDVPMLGFQLSGHLQKIGCHVFTDSLCRSIARTRPSSFYWHWYFCLVAARIVRIRLAQSFTERAITDQQNGVTVRASVLTDEESRRYFGGSTLDEDIQPVWLQVQNDNDKPMRYLPILTDPNYFSPSEVAQRLKGWFSSGTKQAIDAVFESTAMPDYIPAKQTVSGFVFTHEDGGLKFLTVGLLGTESHWLFRFIVPVTGVKYAVQNVDFSKLYPAGSIEDLNLDQLRKKLEESAMLRDKCFRKDQW